MDFGHALHDRLIVPVVLHGLGADQSGYRGHVDLVGNNGHLGNLAFEQGGR